MNVVGLPAFLSPCHAPVRGTISSRYHRPGRTGKRQCTAPVLPSGSSRLCCASGP